MYQVLAYAINPTTGNLYNPCGSDYSHVIELKTLKGVKNRIKSIIWRNKVVQVRIFHNGQCVEIIKDFKKAEI